MEETADTSKEACIADSSTEVASMLGTDESCKQRRSSESVSSKNDDVPNIDNVTDVIGTANLPIDKGWAWFILIGSTLYLIIFGGIKKNYGIVFVAIQEKFGSSASLTSLLATTQNITSSFTSLLITTVGMQFISKRTAIVIGALLYTAAHMISAFAAEFRLLFVSIGFLEGTGAALSYPAVIATLGEYFDKRRGMANGLAFSGATFGGLSFAPIISALFIYYGYSGTFMIFACLTLNMLVTGALLRPVKSFERNRQKTEKGSKNNIVRGIANSRENESEKLITIENRDVADNFQRYNVLQKKDSKSYTVENKISSHPKADDMFPKNYQMIYQHSASSFPSLLHGNQLSDDQSHRRSVSCQNLYTLYASADSVCGSLIDDQFIRTGASTADKSGKLEQPLKDKLKASFDASLFIGAFFPVFLLMAAMLAPSNLLISVFIAPLAKDVGLSVYQTGLLMSIVGGVGMFSRIMCALFADRKFMKLTTLLAVVASVAGITAHCARFFTSFPLMVLMSVIIGLCVEIYQSMYPVILVEYLTLPKLKTCLGFTLFCHGLAAAATFPIVGILRDSTGNYYASYHFLGTISLAGAALALSLPYLHSRRQQRGI